MGAIDPPHAGRPSRDLASFLSIHFRLPTPGVQSMKDKGVPLTPELASSWLNALPAVEQALLGQADRMSELLFSLCAELEQRRGWISPEAIKKHPALAAFKTWPKDTQAAVAVATVLLKERLVRDIYFGPWKVADNSFCAMTFTHIAKQLYRRGLPITVDQARVMLDAHLLGGDNDWQVVRSLVIDLGLVDIFIKAGPPAPADAERLERLRSALTKRSADSALQTELTKFEEWLGHTLDFSLPSSDPWAVGINQFIQQLPADTKTSWLKLLRHVSSCGMTRASAAWNKTARQLSEPLGATAAGESVRRWLADWPATTHPQPPDYRQLSMDRDAAVASYQAYSQVLTHLTGVVWLTALLRPTGAAAALADTSEWVAKQPNHVRTMASFVGGAAVRALADMADDDAVAQLMRLQLRVRWPKLKKQVTKEFEKLLVARGLSREDVEENGVPDFGLRDGVADMPVGQGFARLTIGREDKPSVQWITPDGKASRVMPKSLKTADPDAAARVKQTAADVEKMRAAQRTRLDLLMRRGQTWPAAKWRERYLDHGLVGSLARRLIWLVGDTAMMWHDGTIADINGYAVTTADDAVVSTWHPALRPADEVLAWREVLQQREIVQPFKQAHREIYLLTDAERRTDTYSNRFAAHVVRGPTLLSITQVRQWKSGMYGGASSPSFALPEHGLRAEWWMEAAGQEYTPYGAPLYLATDQLRFVDTATGQPRRIEAVPALPLSEIMRDIDLFVSIASVGNNPEWHDGGPNGAFQTYWQRYSFGDLTETAKTRRGVLGTLMPRLTKLRDRWKLDEKFLTIRGQLRTYKIHLGSGNILMEPNDQYLCIVADRSSTKADNVFLPFEGDGTLSIILSKAFLLAEDDKITDPTITRQIARGS